MSLHFEWTLSLKLRPDVPEAYLDELRFHLGLSDSPVQGPTLHHSVPVLAFHGDEEVLAGGPIARLARQQLADGSATWGMHARIFVVDDFMYDAMQHVPSWLARWSMTEGWIGFAREETALHPWLNFYAARGHAYMAGPGEQPQPMAADTPPFAPTQTSLRWP